MASPLAPVGVLIWLEGQIEADCVQEFESSSLLKVERRCADIAEILAAGQAGIGQIAVVDARSGLVDRDIVLQIRACGLECVLVGSPTSLGAGIHCTSDPRQICQAVLECLPSLSSLAPVADDALQTGKGGGNIVVITSPIGSVGRTSLTINLAVALARLGELVTIVDLDARAPSLRQQLGLLEDNCAIAAALRLSGHERLSPDDLRELCLPGPAGIGVITGLSQGQRWRELSAGALEEFWPVMRQISSWTIVDTAPLIDPQGDDTSYGPDRDDAANSALTHADQVICIGVGGPIGITRLAQHLQLGMRSDRVVVNMVGPNTCGKSATRSVREVFARFLPEVEPTILPWDERLANQSALRGCSWFDLDAEAPLARATLNLAHCLRGTKPKRRGERTK